MAILYVATLFYLVLNVVASSDVIELTEDTFSETLEKHELILISFYDPDDQIWLKQTWYGEAATQLASSSLPSNAPFPVAQIDCKKFDSFCKSHEVTTHPQLKLYREGKFFKNYRGYPKAGDITKFAKKMMEPGATEIKSVKKTERLLDGVNHTVIGFFAEESSLQKAFLVATHLFCERFICAYTTKPAVLEKYGYQNDVVIFQPSHLQTKLEDHQIVYAGGEDYYEMQRWIEDKFAGIVGHVTMENYHLFLNKRPMVTVYFGLNFKLNPKDGKYWRNRIIKVAKNFSDKNVTFGMASKSEFSGLLYRRFLVKEEEVDFVVGIAGGFRTDDRPKYLMQTLFSVENFQMFMQGFVDGTMQPFVKKQPVPENNNGSVKVVVYDNFDEVVRDPTKDVLIVFYQDYCGKCRIFEPKLERIGEKLKNDPNIVIAKIDAMANDPPEDYDVKVEDFPIVFWVGIGKKDTPRRYPGSRLEIPFLIEFMKDVATHPPVVIDIVDQPSSRDEL